MDSRAVTFSTWVIEIVIGHDLDDPGYTSHCIHGALLWLRARSDVQPYLACLHEWVIPPSLVCGHTFVPCILSNPKKGGQRRETIQIVL